jgi:two-component system LytT family response regulator
MQPARVVIADDEQLARDLLRGLVESSGYATVVAEAASVDEAVHAITMSQPDVVLLDIQMPEPDGFAVIARIGADHMPAVVFITAHEQHALRAFDVHALDYVLKPIDPDRFLAALRRANATRGLLLERRLAEVLSFVERDRAYLQRIPIRAEGVTRFIDVSLVERIVASDKTIRVYTRDGAVHSTRTPIGSIEPQLDPREFVRVHRSVIVRVSAIQEVQRWFNDEFVLRLQSGAKVTTGGAYRLAVKAILGQ